MPTNENGPKSIGIIMDGNRRWAKAAGLPQLEGHRVGLEKIKEVLNWARDAGIEEVTIYAFSTENWNRAKEEVEYYMKLIEFAFSNWMEEVIEKGTKIRIIGQQERFSESIQKKMSEAMEKTKDGTNGTLVIALSYGGRAEILDAVNKVIASDKDVVTEEDLREAMWSAGLADPDLIIRTSGEKRLSNFLTWQSTYSELFFTNTMWPAFTKEEFDSIIAEFVARDRRHGK